MLAEKYLDRAGAAATELRDSMIGENLDATRRVAHDLKSNSRIMGLAHLAKVFKNIEVAAKEQDRDAVLAAVAALEKGANLSLEKVRQAIG